MAFAESEITAEAARTRRALGAVIRRRRESAAITLTQLADRAGVSPAFLSEVERGLKEISADRLSALARALDLPLGDLYLELGTALGGERLPAPTWPQDPRAILRAAATSLRPEALRSVADFSIYLAATQATPPRRRIGFTL
jgi:transcriptional regulator with XRE-family HTH domain